jgi:hypothetical protein
LSENAAVAITRPWIAEQRARDLLNLRIHAGVDVAVLRLDLAAAARHPRVGGHVT